MRTKFNKAAPIGLKECWLLHKMSLHVPLETRHVGVFAPVHAHREGAAAVFPRRELQCRSGRGPGLGRDHFVWRKTKRSHVGLCIAGVFVFFLLVLVLVLVAVGLLFTNVYSAAPSVPLNAH